ncbi:penicillin-binding protein 2 [Rhodohalobacter sulfatireducens]|uniref:Penicillin-binding protein 2 n=1 Tax=Rhodohalobacter sulfatireducens TaxID=2911366 RepID=A0ABS9KEA5_9BACT|nr:penicillin-binding protein 2 [Rhodohalobacter sulfatireducens]MCG2589161.1 penicillin-binding protein 2 [Rhodohalobacter sulfatireducens]
MSINRQSHRVRTSAKVLRAVLVIGLLILLARIFQLQIIEYETYTPLSMQNSLRMEVVNPARGLIYDKNGIILVENQPIYSITITPSRFNEEKIPHLSQLLQVEEDLVRERMNEAQQYSWHRTSRLFTEVSFETFSAIQENLWQLPGIGHQVESKRNYPTNVKASHVMGYLREATREEYLASEKILLGDKIGKSGLEMIYDDYLRGEVGTEYIRVNAFGQELGSYEDGMLDMAPKKGADLITTLDAEVQQLSEELMVNKRGGIVAMDPQTGGVLSMVSSPQYDLSKLAGRMDSEYWQQINQDPHTPLYNRAISSRQPPGSTFKPFMGLVGLELGLITPQTEIYNPGYYTRGRRYGDLADPGNYNLEDAITYSSNTYFFWIMDRIASRGMLDSWSELIKDFGIGPKNNIDLPYEVSGIVPDSTYMNEQFGDRYWGVGDLMSLGIGQGMVSASPLQMAVATSTIANGGYRVQPHVVSAIKDRSGEFQYTNPVFEKIEWLNPNQLENVKRGMRGVVSTGGGRYYANLDSIEVAGKTGTAQNPYGEDHGWFIAFAPMDNPQIAVAVLVENAGYGSISAAPIASLVIEKYLTRELNRQRVLDYVLDFRSKETQTAEVN